jgi:hypothetical protein
MVTEFPGGPEREPTALLWPQCIMEGADRVCGRHSPVDLILRRSERTTVSGFTKKRQSFHSVSILRIPIQKMRSLSSIRGRLTLRFRTAS